MVQRAGESNIEFLGYIASERLESEQVTYQRIQEFVQTQITDYNTRKNYKQTLPQLTEVDNSQYVNMTMEVLQNKLKQVKNERENLASIVSRLSNNQNIEVNSKVEFKKQQAVIDNTINEILKAMSASDKYIVSKLFEIEDNMNTVQKNALSLQKSGLLADEAEKKEFELAKKEKAQF